MNELQFNAIRSGLSKRVNDALAIPARYRKLSLQNFDGIPGDVDAARTALTRSSSVFITGPCGVGKTHLAVSLLLAWYADALSKGAEDASTSSPKGLFISTADLVIELGELGKHGEGKFLRKYDPVDCLVLDDLGAERSTPRSRHAVGMLIDRRYRRMRRTLITSNLTLQQIGELYDDRLASRLSGMCIQITLDGYDHRVHREPEQQVLAIAK